MSLFKNFGSLLSFVPLLAGIITGCAEQVDGQQTSGPLPPARETPAIDRQLEKARSLTTVNPDTVILMTRALLEKSGAIKYTSGKAVACNILAAAYEKKVDNKQALSFYEQGLREWEITGNRDSIFNEYALLLRICYINGKYTVISPYYFKAMEYFPAAGRGDLAKAQLWYFMSMVQFEFGKYDSCAYYDQKILTLLPKPDSVTYKRVFGAMIILGAAADRADDDEKALGYYYQAADLARRFRDTAFEAMGLVDASMIYDTEKKYAKCKEIALRTLTLARPTHQWLNIIAGANMVSNALSGEGKNEEALVYMKESYEAARSLGAFTHILNQTYQLAKTYLQVKDYRKALFYLLPAVKMARENGQQDDIGNAYLYLAMSYQGLKNYKKEAEFRALYADVKDSLRGNANAQRVLDVEAKYKTAEKDKQLAEQTLLITQRENKIRGQRQLIAAIVGSLLLLTGLLVFFYRNSRNKQQIELLRAKVEGAGNERVRLSRELHDGIVSQLLGIRLGINALQHNFGKTDSQAAGQASIDHLAAQLEDATKDLRNTAQNLMPELLLQNGLAGAIASLCETTADNTTIAVDFQRVGEMPVLNKDIELSLYRIVQELIQNVIKHARATDLLVQLTNRDRLLCLTVEDNGIGFQYQNKISGGLFNIRQRVQELSGNIDIRSDSNATSVYLEFRTGVWQKLSL